MFEVRASPNTKVPTRIAVIGSKTPNTEALVAYDGILAKLCHVRIIKRESLRVSKSPRLSGGSGRRGSNPRPSAGM